MERFLCILCAVCSAPSAIQILRGRTIAEFAEKGRRVRGGETRLSLAIFSRRSED